MSASSAVQIAIDNLNQAQNTVTACQVDLENAASSFGQAAQILTGGEGKGAEMAEAARALAEEAENIFRRAANLQAEAQDWLAQLSA